MPVTASSWYFDRFLDGCHAVLERIEKLKGTPEHSRYSDPDNAEASAYADGNTDDDLTAKRSHAYCEPASPKSSWELVNLPALAEQAAMHLEASATTRKIQVTVDMDPDALLMGDSDGLRRVLEQLLATALDDAPAGGLIEFLGRVVHGSVIISLTTLWPNQPGQPTPHVWRGFGPGDRVRPLRGFAFQPSFVGTVLRAHSARMEVLHLPGEGSRLVCRFPMS